jgi:hypothetical protein
MGEREVMEGLRDKRAELAGIIQRLEQELAEQRIALVHLDATFRLFDPKARPEEIQPRRPRLHNPWFGQGECLRLIYDVLREAPEPVTTRTLTERVMAAKSITADEHSRALVRHTVLDSLNRSKRTVERVRVSGVVRWRVCQAARALCQ